jgi:ABC-type multidrug transport system ATPase subunit
MIVADGTPEQLQQQFQGAETVTIEIKTDRVNPLEHVAPKLRALSSIGSVELLSQKDSTSRFRLHVEKGADVRESVFHLAVAQGWIVLELNRKTTSLEEVFHKLTMA